MFTTPRVAYDVTVIHDCIVRDTEIFRSFKTKPRKMALYREKQKLLDRHPELKQVIYDAFVQSLDEKRGQYVAKVGWLPSGLVITDTRFREMCRNMFTLPKAYAEATGISFGPCPGILRHPRDPALSGHGPGHRRQRLGNKVRKIFCHAAPD